MNTPTYIVFIRLASDDFVKAVRYSMLAVILLLGIVLDTIFLNCNDVSYKTVTDNDWRLADPM